MSVRKKQYEQIELFANADDLDQITQALGGLRFSPELPALTIRFNNVPAALAEEIKSRLRHNSIDFDEF